MRSYIVLFYCFEVSCCDSLLFFMSLLLFFSDHGCLPAGRLEARFVPAHFLHFILILSSFSAFYPHCIIIFCILSSLYPHFLHLILKFPLIDGGLIISIMHF